MFLVVEYFITQKNEIKESKKFGLIYEFNVMHGIVYKKISKRRILVCKIGKERE